MRCSCEECGEYMVHSERGLTYMCVCPNCGATCDLCLGGNAKEGVVIQKTEQGLQIPEYLKERIEKEYGVESQREQQPEKEVRRWRFDGSLTKGAKRHWE